MEAIVDGCVGRAVVAIDVKTVVGKLVAGTIVGGCDFAGLWVGRGWNGCVVI